MSQQFVEQLEQVCRRRIRRRRLAATCWAVAVIVAVGLMLVGLDRVLAITDLLGRLVLTSAFVGCAAWIASRWYSDVQAASVTPLQVAHEVEQRHPSLRDLVANAWEFANQSDDDPTAGSESLRRAIVLRADTAMQDVDWESMVPREQLRRGAFALAGVSAAACAICWFVPEAMGTGAARLFNPLSPVEWPRQHDLEFVEPPLMLAAGEDLLLSMRDSRGVLPEKVTILYRTRRNGNWHEESQTLSVTGDRVETRRTNVQQPLQFRAIGGDHQTMPWHDLDVLPAPRLEKLVVTLDPPDYTGLASSAWKPGVKVLAGSRLTVNGQVNQPLANVILQGDEILELRAEVKAGGLSFSIDSPNLIVEKSERFKLLLTTAAGLTTAAKEDLSIDVVDDHPPRVRFIKPTDDLTVLPNAEVSLVVEATDELAVREIGIVAKRLDQVEESENQTSLWKAQPLASASQPTREQRVEHRLDLSNWTLPPGSSLELRSWARDAQPRTGQSTHAIRLTVVSEDQLWQRLLTRQAGIVETLAQLMQEQHDLISISGQWMKFPDWSRPRWTRSGHSALFRQRQINATLGTGQASVLQQIDEVLLSIERNKLLRPEATQRLRIARGRVRELVDISLEVVEESLSELTRQTRRTLDPEELTPMIDATSAAQRQIVAGIEAAIEVLTPSNGLGRLERELVDLQREQNLLLQTCQVDIAPRLLSGNTQRDELDEDLTNIERRQRELVRRVGELLLNMTQLSSRLVDSEPMLSARVAETVELARELRVQAAIQSASDSLVDRRIGNAVADQRLALKAFAEMQARLAGRDAQNASERLRELQKTERQLQRLRRQTAELESELKKLSAEQRRRALQRLRRQREQLAEQTENVARKLEKLRLPQAAKSAEQAAEQLQQSTLDRETIAQARKKLEEAQRSLTAERRRHQVALARLQMAQLDAKLKGFVGLQASILEEIRRLEALQTQAGQLTKPQQQSVGQVETRQAALRDDVWAQASTLETLPVFAHMLKASTEIMQRIESRLQSLELGPRTQSDADSVIHQLQRIASALQQEQQEMSNTNQDSGSGSGGENSDSPQAQTLQLALGQLRLLKFLQADLRKKTEAMEQEKAAGEYSKADAEQLAREQSTLTQLAQKLVPEPRDPPIDDLQPNLEDELEQSLDDLLLPNE